MPFFSSPKMVMSSSDRFLYLYQSVAETWGISARITDMPIFVAFKNGAKIGQAIGPWPGSVKACLTTCCNPVVTCVLSYPSLPFFVVFGCASWCCIDRLSEISTSNL